MEMEDSESVLGLMHDESLSENLDHCLERPSITNHCLERPSITNHCLERPSITNHCLERPSITNHYNFLDNCTFQNNSFQNNFHGDRGGFGGLNIVDDGYISSLRGFNQDINHIHASELLKSCNGTDRDKATQALVLIEKHQLFDFSYLSHNLLFAPDLLERFLLINRHNRICTCNRIYGSTMYRTLIKIIY